MKTYFSFSKKTTRSLKILVSAVFVLWVVFAADWNKMGDIARKTDSRFVLLYALTVLLGMMISAKKWQFIAGFKGFRRSFFACFRTYLSGTLVNTVMPGFVGGDMYRAYWLGRMRGSFSSAVSTVVFDRLTGFLAAAVLAIVFSFHQYDAFKTSFLWSFTVVFLFLIVIGTMIWGLVWRKFSTIPILLHLTQFLPRKLAVFLEEVREYSQSAVFAPALLWSFVFNAVGVGLANLALFRAFGQVIPLTDFFAIIFLVNIVASLPVSVNNIGIKEWAYFSFFPLIAVSPEAAITVALAGRLLQMLLSFLAIPDFLKHKKETFFGELSEKKR